MSDIGIRFDGLILLASLLLGAALWSLVAVTAAGVAFFRHNDRAWRLAQRAATMSGPTFAVSAAFFVWWDQYRPTGPDWVDQLTYPWAVVFLAGCWWLTRVR